MNTRVLYIRTVEVRNPITHKTHEVQLFATEQGPIVGIDPTALEHPEWESDQPYYNPYDYASPLEEVSWKEIQTQ